MAKHKIVMIYSLLLKGATGYVTDFTEGLKLLQRELSVAGVNERPPIVFSKPALLKSS